MALRPYYVTLSYSAVVMAEHFRHAERVAEGEARNIISDCLDPVIDECIELKSLTQLRSTATGWDGDCCAYGGDSPFLKDVLPEEEPPVDTKTADMFTEAKKD